MLASDHAPQPCEVAFCKIGVSAVEAVSLGMIDPLHVERRGEHIPVPKIVGGYLAALDDAFSCEGNAIGFQPKRPSQRPPGTLTKPRPRAACRSDFAAGADRCVPSSCWPVEHGHRSSTIH